MRRALPRFPGGATAGKAHDGPGDDSGYAGHHEQPEDHHEQAEAHHARTHLSKGWRLHTQPDQLRDPVRGQSDQRDGDCR